MSAACLSLASWVEVGDHCFSELIPRMQKVIAGDDPGGISEKYEWQGGGGFRFFKLAPVPLEKDK